MSHDLRARGVEFHVQVDDPRRLLQQMLRTVEQFSLQDGGSGILVRKTALELLHKGRQRPQRLRAGSSSGMPV